jgi:hypothetical protein
LFRAIRGTLLALMLSATSRSALAAGEKPPVLVRSYTGTALGIGGYAHAFGGVTITLRLARSEAVENRPFETAGHYEADLALRGACARRSRVQRPGKCLRLNGTLHGDGRYEEEEIPDKGGKVKFAASAEHVGTLGAVSAGCEIYGVGFIRYGTRRMFMKLASRRGAIWITASGPVVPGFSGL